MVIAMDALENLDLAVIVCLRRAEGTCGVPPMTPVVIGIERPRGRGGEMANHTRSKEAFVPGARDTRCSDLGQQPLPRPIS